MPRKHPQRCETFHEPARRQVAVGPALPDRSDVRAAVGDLRVSIHFCARTGAIDDDERWPVKSACNRTV
jgi:hypothetical protein